jgi:hypothetical protein
MPFLTIVSAALSIGESLSIDTRGADIITVAGVLPGGLSFAMTRRGQVALRKYPNRLAAVHNDDGTDLFF